MSLGITALAFAAILAQANPATPGPWAPAAAAPPSAPQASSAAMTLEQVLALADANHADIELARLQRGQAEQDLKGSYSSILPRVDLNAQAAISYNAASHLVEPVPNYSPTGSVLGYTVGNYYVAEYSFPNYNLGVQLTQNLYDGSKWWTRIAKGNTDLDAAKAQLAEAKLVAHDDVGHRFYEVVRARSSLSVLVLNVQRSQDQVNRAEGMYEAGKGQKADIFAAQVNLANDQISVVQQRAKSNQALSDLDVVLGRGPEDPLDPSTGDLSQVPAMPPLSASLVEKALSQRPGLAALRSQEESARSSVTIARGDYFPQIGLQGNYTRNSPVLGYVVGDFGQQYVATGAVVLNWNLFEGRATDVATQKAELGVQTAQENLIRAGQVETDVERAYENLLAAGQSQEISLAASQIAAEGLSAAQQRFEGGVGTTLDVRDAQVKLTQAELNLISTRMDLQEAYVDLRAAMGEL